MQFPRGTLQKLFFFAVVCAVANTTGCGNSCFVGFSNNGNGGIIIKGGNPPPVCTLNQAQGMVRLSLAKEQACVNCAPAESPQHIYLILRGVQIQPAATGEVESTDWIELAPDLSTQPRRIDLMMGKAPAELLSEAPQIPADSYSRVRLQFAAEPGSGDFECGEVASCVVMANGQIKPLRFTDQPQVLLRAAANSDALIVLPGSTTELQIRVGLQAFDKHPDIISGDETARVAGEFFVLRETPTD